MFSPSTSHSICHASVFWALTVLVTAFMCPALGGTTPRAPSNCAPLLSDVGPRRPDDDLPNLKKIDVVRRKAAQAPNDAEELAVREKHLLRQSLDLAFEILFEGGKAPGGIRAPVHGDGRGDFPELYRTKQHDVYVWDRTSRSGKIFVKALPKERHGESPLLLEVDHPSSAYKDYFPIVLVIHEYAHHVFQRDLASRIVDMKKSNLFFERDLAERLEEARDHQWFIAGEELFCDLTAVLFQGKGSAITDSLKLSYGKDEPLRNFDAATPVNDKLPSREHDRLGAVRSWLGAHVLKSGLSDADILRRVHKVLFAHAASVLRTHPPQFYERLKPKQHNQELIDLMRAEFAELF